VSEEVKHNLFAELRRRHVYRVAVAYAAVGWLLIEIATQVFPVFHMPEWTEQLVVLAILIGFPIAVVLAWAFEITPEGVRRTEPADSPVARPAEQRHRVGRTLDFAIIGVLAVAVAILLWRQFAMHDASAPGGNAAAAQSKSIAVLPFENLSSDKANAYFADGIQDEILTGLAKIGDMKVISRTSTQRYASNPDNIPEIARQLGVANILEGSVQRAADKVRINVQLINAVSDSHRWAETYDRTLDDVFAVQSEVAEKIAASLKAQLTGDERERLAARPTENAAAYEAYLRGRALIGSSYDLSVSREGARAFAEAVRLDPKFALAWSNLAATASYMYLNGVDPAIYTADYIKQAADTAFRLQPESVGAQLAQGYYRYRVLRDFAGAEQDFARVLQREPNNVDALGYMGFVERRQGKWTQALQHLLQAAEHDPRNPGLMTTIGSETLTNMRRYDDAQVWLDRALQIAPESVLAKFGKAWTYQVDGRLQDAERVLGAIPQAGEDPQIAWARSYQSLLEHRYGEAVTELQELLARPESALNGWGPQLAINLGYAQLSAGDEAGARQTFERLVGAAKPQANVVNDSLLPIMLAQAYAGLGESRLALEQARRAVDLYRDDAIYAPSARAILAQAQAVSGDHAAAIAGLGPLLKVPAGVTVAMLRLDPIWDSLRGDPGFEALLKDDSGEHAAASRQ
jgi:TolB-like protein/Flp pilus assembly protein TadD